MTKALRLLLLTVFAASAASAQDRQSPPATGFADALKNAEGQEPKCRNDDPKAVVVCGRSQKPYRIDPNVLAATRAAEAAPPKPALDTTTAERCTGPNCGGGSYVPLVGMALTALKAVELAEHGDDWRDAFRTRPDQYRAYEDAKAKEAKKGGVSIGVYIGGGQ